jgi:2',3'-cyclic-nucleotide 2'-phosphodiesterase (5'-nucleotidase family)
MVKLKKYHLLLQQFVLFLTFSALLSCSSQKFSLTKIEGKQIAINNTNSDVASLDNYIKPYREHIDNDLNTVLAYAPQTIDKSGQWQSAMGNLLADVTRDKGNHVFMSLENKLIDICLLNHGGIRAIINKGDVTTRTAFEIMPFENTLIVVGMKSEQIIEIADYIIKDKKPHPLAGMTFTIDKNNQPKNILIHGFPLNDNILYYVATSDYLANGGDNMNFFKKGVEKYDLDYKLRNILIDYFKDVDTIPITNDIRISVEQ